MRRQRQGYYRAAGDHAGVSVTVTVVDQMGYRPTSPPTGTEQVTVGDWCDRQRYEFWTVSVLPRGQGSTGTLLGTGQADTFTWQAGTSNHTVSVNGESVTIDIGTVSNVVLDAGNGDDTITMTGDAREESFLIRAGTIDVTGSGYTIEAKKFESGDVYSGGDPDSIAYLYDTSSDDVFTATTTMAQMVGGGLDFTAHNFKEVHGRSTDGGNDYAYLTTEPATTYFPVWLPTERCRARAVNSSSERRALIVCLAFATAGGNDIAYLHDDATNDVLTARQHNSVLRGSGYEFYNKVNGFEFVFAYSTAGGNDEARMYDSSADDTFDVDATRRSHHDAGRRFVQECGGRLCVSFAGTRKTGELTLPRSATRQGDDSFTGLPSSSTARQRRMVTTTYVVDGFRSRDRSLHGGRYGLRLPLRWPRPTTASRAAPTTRSCEPPTTHSITR